ncbi:Putative F0F1-ATPase subunit Ca2+/Mg2+ transporter [Selenomonas sp. GACV-9]|uniref:AtpZ/AtpI family protein n=1 Tax=Selenomonas sp. GACV-9 TaxID=3158782 RepID=UPI0008E7D223|nr:Putative F0F1-ATPase subunit Ca2+/Mg2+ transporter [Selenomonas ruminantium]
MDKKVQTEQEVQKHEGLRQAVKAFSVLGGIGIYLVVFVGICVFLGNLADENLGLDYAGKLIGIIVGFPGAIYTLYRQLKQGNVL